MSDYRRLAHEIAALLQGLERFELQFNLEADV